MLLLPVALKIPAFAGKVLAEIEYFYADDGAESKFSLIFHGVWQIQLSASGYFP